MDVEGLLALVQEKQSRPAHHSASEPHGPLTGMAVFLAGLARAMLFSFKHALVGSVRKRAFITLGRRTTRTAAVTSKAEPTTKRTSIIPPKLILLVKNMTLGISVFLTYEYVVDHYYFSARAKGNNRSPLFVHFLAGACSGLAQTTVMTTWEVLAVRHSKLLRLDTQFLLRRAIHHSVGYASLFGCFEFFRIQLLQQLKRSLERGSDWVPMLFDKMQKQMPQSKGDLTPITLTAAFVAGGLAGQVHHVVSHYTGHWKLQAATKANKAKATRNTGSFLYHARKQWPSPPSVKSTMGAFVPAGLCFVAFQYGGELASRMVPEEPDFLTVFSNDMDESS